MWAILIGSSFLQGNLTTCTRISSLHILCSSKYNSSPAGWSNASPAGALPSLRDGGGPCSYYSATALSLAHSLPSSPFLSTPSYVLTQQTLLMHAPLLQIQRLGWAWPSKAAWVWVKSPSSGLIAVTCLRPSVNAWAVSTLVMSPHTASPFFLCVWQIYGK